MKINFRTIGRVADLYVELSTRLEIKRYYLSENPTPLLMVIHARTFWGILAIASHWFRRLNSLASMVRWSDKMRVGERTAENLLKQETTQLLLSAKGVEIYTIAPLYQYDDDGNEALIPLSNFMGF